MLINVNSHYSLLWTWWIILGKKLKINFTYTRRTNISCTVILYEIHLVLLNYTDFCAANRRGLFATLLFSDRAICTHHLNCGDRIKQVLYIYTNLFMRALLTDRQRRVSKRCEKTLTVDDGLYTIYNSSAMVGNDNKIEKYLMLSKMPSFVCRFFSPVENRTQNDFPAYVCIPRV